MEICPYCPNGSSSEPVCTAEEQKANLDKWYNTLQDYFDTRKIVLQITCGESGYYDWRSRNCKIFSLEELKTTISLITSVFGQTD